VVSSPSGQTFPIALIGAKDREAIPLSRPKPQLLSVQCLDQNYTDVFNLTSPVRTQLRAATMPVIRGDIAEEPRLVYLDDVSEDIPDSYRPQVIYNSQTNRFTVRLLRFNDVVAQRESNLPKQDAEALAKVLVQEILQIVPQR
jgi:hypothetical protein